METRSPYARFEFINEFNDQTITEFSSPDFHDISELGWIVNNFRQFLLAVGFSPVNVTEYFPEE
jgi:hypothetical protein